MKYVVIEINETEKTFHFLNEYTSLDMAKAALKLYKQELKELKECPKVRYEIQGVQE